MAQKIDTGTVIVVADGERGLIFENTGDAQDLNLRHVETLTPKNLEDDGPAGKRPPESSGQETDEATFAKQLANALYKRVHANRGKAPYKKLVLIADPETLGQMRQSLHQEVTDRILFEMDKTLTNAPISDIERSLEAYDG